MPEEIYINPADEQCIIWAIRFFLGRNPLNQEEIAAHHGHSSFVSVRTAFCQTHEFKSFYAGISAANLTATSPAITVDDECIKWAIRFFLGRNPIDQTEIAGYRVYQDFNALRIDFCRTAEFTLFYVWANPGDAAFASEEPDPADQLEATFINPADEKCVIWAIRFFLGRNPLNRDEIDVHSGHFNFVSVRTAFCQTHEFKSFYAGINSADSAAFVAASPAISVDNECIKWAIRFFLGRNPINQTEVESYRHYQNFNALRTVFCLKPEFGSFYVWANPGATVGAAQQPSKAPPAVTATAGHSIDVGLHQQNNEAGHAAGGMIKLENVMMSYHTRKGINTVLKGINLCIMPGEKVGILGANGAGKSTLIRLISGAERPSSGSIIRTMSVSWPLAFGGAFQGTLTGLDNLRFICRVYGVSIEDKIPYVQEFSELGKYLREPVKTYSSGMLARLAFAISMVIEFDCYLIDEVISVGDARFTVKCQQELFEKRRDRAMIMVSHQPYHIREHCTRACVIKDGVLHDFTGIDEAYEYYQSH